jgi:hypothetical protein
MDTKQKLAVWESTVLGTPLDVDRAYGAQCADVPLSWGITVFPGIAWPVLFKPIASAKDFFTAANDTYFEKIVNNHADPNQLPQAGDIAVFAAQNADQRKKGYTSPLDNPDGHAGVVDHADHNFVTIVQQDGSDAHAVVQLRQRPWRQTECIGWLRPRVSAQTSAPPSTGPVNHPLIGKEVWFKPIAGPDKNWSVYRVGQYPDRTKRIGAMRPDWFHEGPNGQPGFIKRIEGVSQYANTVTIHTDTYGLVDVYLDSDAQIL